MGKDIIIKHGHVAAPAMKAGEAGEKVDITFYLPSLISVGDDFGIEMMATPNLVPVVALNRDGSKCWTPVDRVQSHNGHVPVFESMSEMETYIARVKQDVQVALAQYNAGHYEQPHAPEWGVEE
jgi:hypothetical protein|tara:strand:+ start:151 stop:522 length:372 start_codon:yes stop_codon:yes gene_type:complete